MPFHFGKAPLLRYLEKHPNVQTIVIAGSYGRKSAIRSLGVVLGEMYTVSFGLNKDANPDFILLDYESAAEFPEFSASVVVVTACQNEEEAQKYFAVANRAKAAIINRSDVSQELIDKYLQNENSVTYGDELPANYYFENTGFDLDGQSGEIVSTLSNYRYPVKFKILGEHNVRPLIMAMAVARLYGVDRDKVLDAAEKITPLHGRMSPARGINGSIIIDDSADGTPTSVYYGLRTLYQIEAPSKIVVTDDPTKLENINFDQIAEALILAKEMPSGPIPEHFKYFTDELELVNYIGQRSEEGGIILLEIPLPQIIEKYLWQ